MPIAGEGFPQDMNGPQTEVPSVNNAMHDVLVMLLVYRWLRPVLPLYLTIQRRQRGVHGIGYVHNI